MAFRFGWSFSVFACEVEPVDLVAKLEQVVLESWDNTQSGRPLNRKVGQIAERVFECGAGGALRLSLYFGDRTNEYFVSLGGHLIGTEHEQLGRTAANYAKEVLAQVVEHIGGEIEQFQLDVDGSNPFCEPYSKAFAVA